MVIAVNLSTLKDHSNKMHLETLEDENRKLISLLVGTDDVMAQRIDPATTCSTMSLVHLQYKYEELVKNHNSLLKMLDARLNEMRKYQKENISLNEEVQVLMTKLHNCRSFISELRERIRDIKIRKNNKISKLRNERDTLRIVHNRLVNLLNKQYRADDNHLREQLKYINEPKTAQLMQEVRKNNLLSYENFRLQQEVDYLRSILRFKRVNSAPCMGPKTCQ
ncbi:unnamed protein product [Acanthoscelides obtectus]|uniref:Uncharacterized protein n=1 Tax=Acanthoscelides obtectus TaxID=200917 RepID=A0A9P0K0L3_ACAOB|nr:unnamed protein product [Acanthoscelides obtectus]CAK1654120.1 hypothetical protein AOBTE_LOCUS18458 [Acanthoscelides obtectus]